MAAVRPHNSGQWLAGVGLVLGVAASEVVLAAVCGAGPVRGSAHDRSGLIFRSSYLVTPFAREARVRPASLRRSWRCAPARSSPPLRPAGLVSPLCARLGSARDSRGRWFGRAA